MRKLIGDSVGDGGNAAIWTSHGATKVGMYVFERENNNIVEAIGTISGIKKGKQK